MFKGCSTVVGPPCRSSEGLTYVVALPKGRIVDAIDDVLFHIFYYMSSNVSSFVMDVVTIGSPVVAPQYDYNSS